MPTIRDLVVTIRRREGVDAALVVGRDGLVIDGQLAAGLDADDLAARLPAILTSAEGMSASADRGSIATIVFEFDRGVGLLSTLSADAVLFVLASDGVNVGPLLLELRRNREHIAALV